MSNNNATDRQGIIDGLNEDLAREYQAIIQYVVFSSTLKGPEYGDIAEELKLPSLLIVKIKRCRTAYRSFYSAHIISNISRNYFGNPHGIYVNGEFDKCKSWMQR